MRRLFGHLVPLTEDELKAFEDRLRTGPEIRAQLRGTLTFKNGSWAIGEHEVENVEIERTL